MCSLGGKRDMYDTLVTCIKLVLRRQKRVMVCGPLCIKIGLCYSLKQMYKPLNKLKWPW